MKRGTIESVTDAKSGKSLRVKIDGNWYGASKKIGLQDAKGKAIMFEFADEGFGPWISEGWAYADEQTSSAGNKPPQSATVPANGASNGDRWYMPFVSNQVAHAIAAGLITDPLQMAQWAKAAKQAASEL